MTRDPYDVLGVSRDAGAEEIKRAYRRKAKECHPDLHPDDPLAHEKMQAVNEAYRILSDPQRRAGWSRTEAQGSAWEKRRAAYEEAWRQPQWSFAEQDRRPQPRWDPLDMVFRVFGGLMLLRFFGSLLRFALLGF